MSMDDKLNMTQEQDSNRGWILLAFWLAGIGYSILNFILYRQSGGQWQLLATNIMAISFSIAAGIGTWLNARGKQHAGMALTLVAFALSTLILNIFADNLGLITGIGVILLVTIIAGKSLPQREATIVNILGIFVGLISIVIDLYDLIPFRYNTPTLTTLTPWFIIPLVTIALLTVLRDFNNYSLRAKLLAGFGLLSLLTAGSLAFYSAYVNRQNLEQSIAAEMGGQAGNNALIIGELLHKQLETLQILAINSTVQTALQEKNAQYTGNDAEIEAQLLALDEQWRDADDADDLIVDHLTHPVVQELVNFRELFPSHAEIFLTDRYGGLLGTIERTSDYFQADEGWWTSTFRDGVGGRFISQPLFDESSNITGIQFGTPIYDDQQVVIGVLRSTYSLEKIGEVLSHRHDTTVGTDTDVTIFLPDNKELFVIDNVDDPENPLIVITELDDFDIHEFVQDAFVHDEDSGGMVEEDHQEDSHQHAPASSEGETTLAIHDHEGVSKYLIAFHIHDSIRSPEIETLDWVVGVEREVTTVVDLLETGNRQVTLLSIVLVGLTGLGALALAQYFSNPLLQLSQAATKLGMGDLNVRSDYIGRDEIGTLSSTFNQMASQLELTLTGLEDQVQARTRDLLLAVEIGQELAEVQETDKLLEKSVSTLQHKFDLYHAQIYLVDSTGQELLLRGAAGKVGQTLLKRGHRLPIGPGSINGTAAATRKPVVVSDTVRSNLHLRNPELPLTRSEITVPMVSGDKLLGVLNLQSDKANELSNEKLPVFAAIANQLTASIENASLFTEAVQAQRLLESQTKMLLHEGWADFMNAIEQDEHMGYSFDLTHLQPIDATDEFAENKNDQLAQPIMVSDLPVGIIQVESGEKKFWSKADSELVEAVAQQVSVQIEGLRLLAQADRYRDEAEQAVQRLTREGWESYQKRKGGVVGYNYDQNRVVPIEGELLDDAGISQDLLVRNQVVGKLAIDGISQTDEHTKQFVDTVAEQLSAHIENLRLTEEIETALLETEQQAKHLSALNEMSNEMVQATSIQEISNIVVDRLGKVVDNHHVTVLLYDERASRLVVNALAGRVGNIQVGTVMPVYNTVAGNAIDQRKIITIANTSQSQLIDAQLFNRLKLRSLVAVPLQSGSYIIGSINVARKAPDAFSAQEITLLQQVASLTSATAENQNLLKQTESALATTELINDIGLQLSAAESVSGLLDVLITSPVLSQSESAVIGLIERDRTSENLQWLKTVAVWHNDSSNGKFAVGDQYKLLDNPAIVRLLNAPTEPLIYEDATADDSFTPQEQAYFKSLNIYGYVVMPLVVGNQLVGSLAFSWDKPHRFSDEDGRFLGALVSVVGAVFQNQNLLEQTRQRAENERRLREITERLYSATNLDTILQMAAEEVGRTLGRKTRIQLGNGNSATVEKVHETNGTG